MKRIIIVGATSGIGREIACLLQKKVGLWVLQAAE